MRTSYFPPVFRTRSTGSSTMGAMRGVSVFGDSYQWSRPSTTNSVLAPFSSSATRAARCRFFMASSSSRSSRSAFITFFVKSALSVSVLRSVRLLPSCSTSSSPPMSSHTSGMTRPRMRRFRKLLRSEKSSSFRSHNCIFGSRASSSLVMSSIRSSVVVIASSIASSGAAAAVSSCFSLFSSIRVCI